MKKRKKIVLTKKIIPEAYVILNKHYQLINLCSINKNIRGKDVLEDIVGLFCMADDVIDREVIDLFPNLKIISNIALGYNNIDYEYASSRNIAIATIDPNSLVHSVVEFTFAQILSFSRRLREADKYIREKKFNKW